MALLLRSTDKGDYVRRSLFFDLAERSISVLLAVPFLIAFARALPLHPQYLLTAVSEMLSVIFILIRRPGAFAITPYAFLIALAGSGLPLLVRPGGEPLLPVLATTLIMSAGMCLSVSAKLFLNRSFGIVAANRGVKRGGPYKVIRHPMYAGYGLTQVGFLLASFNLANLILYVVAWGVQLLRLREEERFLSADPLYQEYQEKVRYRLAPGLI